MKVPPAWTQEAYRPPCSEYSFCCPTRVPPPPGGVPDLGNPPGGYLTRVPPRGGTWPGYPWGVPDLGTPPGGYLTRVPPRGVPDPGTPPGRGVPDPGTPPQGGYLTQVPPRGVPDLGTPLGGLPDPGTPPGGVPDRVPPHRCLMAFWEMLQSIMGYGYPPPVDRQIGGWTDACQNITFPRTTYAGGNNEE